MNQIKKIKDMNFLNYSYLGQALDVPITTREYQKMYIRDYMRMNKDQMKEYYNELIECPNCGQMVRKGGKIHHMKTLKCIKNTLKNNI